MLFIVSSVPLASHRFIYFFNDTPTTEIYTLSLHDALPQAITVKDVMEASEHVTFEVNCDLHPVDPHRCSPETSCSIRPVWRMLERRINDLLDSISLADLQRDESDVLYQIAGALAGN